MLTAAENDLLCRVEGDAPMGRLMRRHWVPAMLSEQVAEPDGAPVRVQLFGEKLVAFRDSNGKVGVLGESCPHRKASLAFGRNEECGLRCLYHGWKFDTDGNVVDMPSEPKAERSCRRTGQASVLSGARSRRLRLGLYGPGRGDAGIRGAAMGAAGADTHVAIARIELPCNWAQIMEGQIDSAHSSTLHSSDMRPAQGRGAAKGDHWVRPSTDKNPRIQVQLTNYGMRYAAIRRPIVNANDARLCADHDLCRAVHRADPAEQLLTMSRASSCRATTPAAISASSPGAEGEQAGISTEAWRKFCVPASRRGRRRRSFGRSSATPPTTIFRTAKR